MWLILKRLSPSGCFLSGVAIMALLPERTYLKLNIYYHNLMDDDLPDTQEDPRL